MKIEDFIDHIENSSSWDFTRGSIIDFISDNEDNWILVLKALLIKNPSKFIAKEYLLEKLNFMKNRDTDQQGFLDFQGRKVYEALLDTPKVKIVDLTK